MCLTIARVALVAIAAIALAGCYDKQPLAPKEPPSAQKALIVQQPPYLRCYPILNNCPVDNVVQITGGDYFTCARRASGAVDCWGKLGGQTLTAPTRIWTGATQIDAGSGHACGLTSTGQAFCWGDEYNGELGIPGPYQQTGVSPTAVCGAWCGAAPIQFTSISAGSSSTCGTAVDGVYCWGIIVNGSGYSVPNKLSSRNDYNRITVGFEHACAWVTPAPATGSSLDCWGVNNYGQAGKNPSTYPTVPFSMSTFVFVNDAGADAGGQYTCANQINGFVQCFGYNTNGQLGSATVGYYGYTGNPVLVGDGSLPSGLHATATGRVHACAVDQGNSAYCWGYNGYGEVGNGVSGNTQYQTPQKVSTTHTFTQLAAGQWHSCGIADDGHVYCWGNNWYGQLGNANTSTNSAVPILVSGT